MLIARNKSISGQPITSTQNELNWNTLQRRGRLISGWLLSGWLLSGWLLTGWLLTGAHPLQLGGELGLKRRLHPGNARSARVRGWWKLMEGSGRRWKAVEASHLYLRQQLRERAGHCAVELSRQLRLHRDAHVSPHVIAQGALNFALEARGQIQPHILDLGALRGAGCERQLATQPR